MYLIKTPPFAPSTEVLCLHASKSVFLIFVLTKVQAIKTMGGKTEEIMLSATSTTVQQALQCTWTFGNGCIPYRAQVSKPTRLHAFQHPLQERKNKINPKKPKPKPHHPPHTAKCCSSLLGQPFS